MSVLRWLAAAWLGPHCRSCLGHWTGSVRPARAACPGRPNRPSPARPGSARLGSAQPGPARPGPARLGPARPGRTEARLARPALAPPCRARARFWPAWSGPARLGRPGGARPARRCPPSPAWPRPVLARSALPSPRRAVRGSALTGLVWPQPGSAWGSARPHRRPASARAHPHPDQPSPGRTARPRNNRGTGSAPHPSPAHEPKKKPKTKPKTSQPQPKKAPIPTTPPRPGEPPVTYTSDVRRERERTGARCAGMRVPITITRPPHHSTGVAAVPNRAVTLGAHLRAAMRRPCEGTAIAPRPTSGCFLMPTPRSLRGVTESHPLTSPGSGAVVTGVRKLTCSAISNPRRQGGDEPMSLAPEVR